MINWFSRKETQPQTIPQDLNLSHLKINPLPFQREGINFLHKCDGLAYLGDDPGLGKTLQVIAYTSANNLRTLVICPSYLKYNWKNEIEKFTNCSSTIVTVNTSGNFDYYIVNYDVLINQNIQVLLGKIKFDIVVCDESHYIMNPGSKRSLAIKSICKDIPKRICMSGTPIKSRPEEFFTQLQFLHPEISDFSNQKQYQIKYCSSVKTKLGSTNNLKDNPCLLELHAKIKPFYIRRTKTEVLSQLPKKTFIPVELTLDGNYTCTNNSINPLTLITAIKQDLSKKKLPLVIEHIDNLLNSGEKVIVFSQYTETLDLLSKHYGSLSVLHKGQMSAKKKQDAIDAFQKDPNTMVLIGNIATAIGYNAVVSCNVIYVDLPWTPADIIQSADRSHRIGQEHPVSVYMFYYKNSLEEDIYKLLYEKQKVFTQVVDGTIDTDETLSIQQMILRKLKVA